MGVDADGRIVEELRRHIDSGELVLFVGNGVRRVPTRILDADGGSQDAEGTLGPSWQTYMEGLWELVRARGRAPRDDDLDFAAFSRLTAPRQAEWFDRRAREVLGVSLDEAVTLRMHFLGCDLHPRNGVPHNRILDLLAGTVLQTAARSTGEADLVTTNVDCALEQSIAWAVERSGSRAAPPTLEVHTAGGHTATWRRAEAALGPTIRIWKIHGCLNTLKTAGLRSWPETRARLGKVAEAGPWRAKLDLDFAGDVPMRELWRDSPWRNDDELSPRAESLAVFSMTEYLDLLHELFRDEAGGVAASLSKLFTRRPILFVGYDLHEVDVDVIATLHRSRLHEPSDDVPRYALRFRKDGDAEPHEAERLRQMGVRWWPFGLGPLALARLPGDLRLTARHEWRHGGKAGRTPEEMRADLDNPWRKKLQGISAGEWLRAQEARLRALTAAAVAPPPGDAKPRLVIAGLASIWHAFALKRRDDLPSRRRVSANLAAVDSQVPGGSGLVPAMVAAAAAGPDDAGQITFLTNVAREWARWDEVEEFCLGASIDVRPLEGGPRESAGARTSHVLLYDPEQKDDTSWRPRQRMIIDVDDLVDPGLGGSAEGALAPKVGPVAGVGSNGLLFADKLADSKLLESWEGPIVFETGSSGDELLDQAGRPTVWTAGLGSLMRTLVCARFGHKVGNRWQADLPQDVIGAAIGALAADPDLRELVDRSAPGAVPGEYVGLINSFNGPLWPRPDGVTHEQELTYGRWLQDRWHDLGDAFWRILDRGPAGGALLTARGPLGRGFLATLHEAGLMAHLDLPDRGKGSVVVRIEAVNGGSMLRFTSVAAGALETSSTLPPVTLDVPAVSGATGRIVVQGTAAVTMPLAERLRRHTLGAGDTVRGCLAYGLWAWVFETEPRRRPRSLEHVLLASCVLASLKCYAGSFVEFLRVIETIRATPAWALLWGFPS